MGVSWLSSFAAGVVLLCATTLRAQEDPPFGADVTQVRQLTDVTEVTATGGVWFEDRAIDFSIRCDSALVVFDRTESARLQSTSVGTAGPPRRDAPLPSARRLVDEKLLRSRIDGFLAALRRRPLGEGQRGLSVELFRSVYLEGDVTIVFGGIEVLRCKSLHFSPIDDRVRIVEPTLRLLQSTAEGRPIQITVRAAELVRQHGRFTGRTVSLTTSTAGEPQFDVLSDDIEIRERADEFEVFARGNQMRVHGTAVLPLPDQHIFTADQDQLLIKGASAGISQRLGPRARILWGSTFNDFGGSIHEWLTGRPADEFRGTWRLGTGWIEKRGFPIDADLRYKGGDLYEGRLFAMGIDDALAPIGPIRRELDGSRITPDARSMLRTENRVHFSERTELDVTAFWASDPSIFPDFYRGEYNLNERPETSAYLRHRGDSWIGIVGVRGNLADFSYADGRQLANRFGEELPYATLDWFSQPLLEFADRTPLLLTTSSGIGMLQSNWGEGATGTVDDRTFRFDQEIELAVPARFGVVNVRPFLATRYTGYERTAVGGAHGRFASQVGAEMGTELARDFDLGGGSLWRHEVVPTVRYENRFAVQRTASDFFQQDAVDALTERSALRVGVLQRLLSRTRDRSEPVDSGSTSIDQVDAHELDEREEVWLDLAQRFAPNADRDNGGDVLDVFEFELLVRSLRFTEDVSLGLMIEGEQDWNIQELRTFNIYTQLRTGRLSWLFQYRTDQVEKGIVGYGVSIPLRTRWQIDLRGTYDIERSRSAFYVANLIRNDLDWRLFFGLTYDVVTDDTSFNIDFEPRLGNLVRQNATWNVGGYEFGASRIFDY
ncbi:MAG: hypothetical protein AB7I19_04730 [Planctomycetota bacterium]